MIHHISLADLYYDKLNRIDLLDEASQRSRDLLNTALIRSTEITLAANPSAVDRDLEEPMYIDRTTAVNTPVEETVSARPSRKSAPKEQPKAKAQPARGGRPEPVSVHKDGLEEL